MNSWVFTSQCWCKVGADWPYKASLNLLLVCPKQIGRAAVRHQWWWLTARVGGIITHLVLGISQVLVGVQELDQVLCALLLTLPLIQN